MNPKTTPSKAGLDGVVAFASNVCRIDGDVGTLSFCGYDIHTLVEHATFEEVTWLLWHGHLPKQAEFDQLSHQLFSAFKLPLSLLAFLRANLQAPPMDVLRTAVSMLGLYDPDAREKSSAANRRKAVRLVARTSMIVAAFGRLRLGRDVVAPDPNLSFAANFLYCLSGKQPDAASERTVDKALILHAEHELNASTFVTHVTASTLSDMYAAVTSAIGAMKGPLHGGANEAVMRLLLEIGTADKAVERVQELLAQKVRIPGFSRRVYRAEDPRSTQLKRMSCELSSRTGQTDLHQMSTLIEAVMKSEKQLNPTIDFYSASTFHLLGIPIDLFTPVFVVGRMSGWTAHVLEQYSNNRLITPRADYTGNADGLPWLPIGSR